MRATIITGALLLSAALLTAQENTGKQTKVRVKKTENINGVEKITDTTYFVSGPITIPDIDKIAAPEKDQPGITRHEVNRMVIVTDDEKGADVTNISSKENMDELMQKALKAAGVDGKTLTVNQIIIPDKADVIMEKNGNVKVVIVKTTTVVNATPADARQIEKQNGSIDQKLALENLYFYPNPSNGRFTLSFELPGKGDTEISILNAEGKQVYKEMLKDFSGSYKKEVDISLQPKGSYFVKVKQGDHAQLKKIILE